MKQLDYSALQFWLSIVQVLSTGVIGIYVWWSNREKVTTKKFEEHAGRLADVENKIKGIPTGCAAHTMMTNRMDGHNDRLGQHKALIDTISTDLKHLLTKDDLEPVYNRINGVASSLTEMSKELGKLVGAMPGITHVTEMMNEFLIHQGRK